MTVKDPATIFLQVYDKFTLLSLKLGLIFSAFKLIWNKEHSRLGLEKAANH